MEGSGVADLVTPPVEEVVSDGEEHGEEESVGEVERQCQSIGGLCVVVEMAVVMEFERFAGVDGRRNWLGVSPANVHCWFTDFESLRTEKMRKERAII